MKLTNKNNLPQPIFDAIANDEYSKGECDYTVTQLLKPPRMVILEQKHWDELEEDISDRIWMLMGSAIHWVLERNAASGLAEKRLYTDVKGKHIGGKFDYFQYDNKTLSDYKVCSAWQVVNHLKGDKGWEEQLNCYAYLLSRNGIELKQLQIVAFLRDWSKASAHRDPDYPQSQVQVINISLWWEQAQREFLEDRVRLHEAAKECLPECTEPERWCKSAKWALIKNGNKKATRVYDEKPFDYDIDNYHVEFRPGESVRCGLYCLVGKNGLCEQFNNEKKENENERVESKADLGGG